MTEQEMKVDQGQMIAGLRERGCKLDGVYACPERTAWHGGYF